MERQKEVKNALYECLKIQFDILALSLGGNFQNEVEDLVDGLLFSDLQDTACLKWWEQNEATYLAKGPAGKALVALAKR